jgi:hypothetical protein
MRRPADAHDQARVVSLSPPPCHHSLFERAIRRAEDVLMSFMVMGTRQNGAVTREHASAKVAADDALELMSQGAGNVRVVGPDGTVYTSGNLPSLLTRYWYRML